MALGSRTIPSLPRVVSEEDLPALMKWLADVRIKLNKQVASKTFNTIQFDELHAEPSTKIEGMVARADGADWAPLNPGEDGLYYYNGLGWRLIVR